MGPILAEFDRSQHEKIGPLGDSEPGHVLARFRADGQAIDPGEHVGMKRLGIETFRIGATNHVRGVVARLRPATSVPTTSSTSPGSIRGQSPVTRTTTSAAATFAASRIRRSTSCSLPRWHRTPRSSASSRAARRPRSRRWQGRPRPRSRPSRLARAHGPAAAAPQRPSAPSRKPTGAHPRLNERHDARLQL